MPDWMLRLSLRMDLPLDLPYYCVFDTLACADARHDVFVNVVGGQDEPVFGKDRRMSIAGTGGG